MNPTAVEPGAGLPEIIEAQIACTAKLVDVLEAERAALLASDVDGLELACKTKAMAAAHLQQLAERMAAQVGAPRSGSEIEALLTRRPNGNALIIRWKELGRLAALCSEGNRANGTLLEVREKQVRGALAALQPEAPAVYGRRGAQRSSLRSQIVSRA